ncbi:acyltransferase [Paenibacillus sp. NEAU-GSW1]|uniref:acyltransferase n=1 Tax=Paenibacillus sp. NEAU-GSW1 TaxID=2682486 RepID=UPI0012E194B5|nr:acyltransferase [Paenibacillus sp. NEAU-GSW1]MUT67748.1 acyltransferase family protein [Paenibacillus sp. NEAU-GSW1]
MATAALQKKENIPELQLVRAMAIIGVLSVHSTSYATLDMVNSNYFFLYNFFNIFMKFGTTTFIFLSSFVLFYNYYSRPLTKELVGGFYKKRLLYIIVPYVVFSIFYFAILHVTHYQGRSLPDTLASFWDKLLHGKAYTHLYFVYISIQFYLMFPLFLALLKKFPSLVKWTIPAGIAIQWAFILINKYGLAEPVQNRGSWSLSYFSYYLLGAALGIYYPKIKEWVIIAKENITKGRAASWIILWACWLAAGLAHVNLYYMQRQKIYVANSTMFDLIWNVHALLTALVLLQLAHLLYRKLPSLPNKLLARIGALSFGIYLIHPFFLLFYREYPPQTGTAWLLHLWYLGGFLLALVASWIVVALVARFIPFSWVIFGNLPKPKKKPSTPVVPERQLDV